MPKITLILAAAAALALVGSPQSADANCTYGQRGDGSCWADLMGWWNTDEGQQWLQQDGNDFYVLHPQACAAGRERNRDWYLTGQVAGNVAGTSTRFEISGIMWRCTEGRLVQECGHPGSYKIPFKGTAIFSETRFTGGRTIEIEYNMEYWKIPECQKDSESPKKELVFQWIGEQLPPVTPKKEPDDSWKEAWDKFGQRSQDKFWKQKKKPLIN